MSEVKQQDIDSTVFEGANLKKTECEGAGTGNCSYLSRINAAIKYSELMGRAKFLSFCMSKYCWQYVEDYIHFICHHHDNDEDIRKIADGLQRKCGNPESAQCVECEWTRRHFRDRNEGKKEEEHFYLDILDTIHFYIYHIKQFGFRISMKIKEQKEDEINGDYLNCKDGEIEHIQKEIELKRKKYNLSGRRLDGTNHSKFNIMITTKSKPKTKQNDDEKKKRGNKTFGRKRKMQ